MHAVDLKLRILIVDDDEDDFFITSEYIKNIPNNNFVIEWCYKYDVALKHICGEAFDIYLIDYHLGAKTGLDMIKEAIKNGCDQPMILLTGKGNHKIDIEAMQAGAVDYLIKSELDTEKLERCLRYSIERARSTKALKANEKKFRNIFERSADAVFLADAEFVFKDINDATSKLLEYSKPELLSMSLYEVLNGGAGKIKDEILKREEIDNMEIILKTRSGQLKYCILSLSAEENTGLRHYQGIIHDITEMKKAEKANLRIEKRGVADRLAHVLAHEVRNPLNNINLSLEQLTPDLKLDETKIFLDIISRNSKRIEDLITELLSTSRPAQVVQSPQSLHKIVEASLAAANDRITLKKISLKLDFPEVKLMVLADEEKLKIALLNIIINAVEAVEQEKGELEVSLAKTDGNIQLLIKDNGCGISEENLSRLFEPYFTAKRNGLGLGLASTLNILQSHKAEVEVISRLNEGTLFIISFREAE
jgi:PAS domain S-box-containing protein